METAESNDNWLAWLGVAVAGTERAMYMKFPLWLNAETVNMSDKEIDQFISLCTHNFPKATLSIGMLHKGQKIGSEIGYNAKLVTQMKDTLTRNNVTQTVAFTVRLLTAAYSLDTLPALKNVKGITDSALYMYNKKSNEYSSDELSNINKLINMFGRNRVYLDTPFNLLMWQLSTTNRNVLAWSR
uniref:Menorin-like domain-containing protein n=1 Tax=Timema douglasi TaxID=61478 RepID=A0A7R8VVS5_TIMDO|nr:unnamed protein product [Timema douglasi]